MANRWVLLLAAGLLSSVSSVWALDLSIHHDSEQTDTPVMQIFQGNVSDADEAPAQRDGLVNVNTIQTMEYRPQTVINASVPVSGSTAPVSFIVPPAQKVIKITPTFAVFPVLDHRLKDKAFADLPFMFSTAIANRLADKFYHQGLSFTVLNPMYAYDTLKDKGLETLYNKMIEDYREAGRPNEKDLATIADQLSTQTQHVDWIVFARAEFDMNNPDKPKGLEIPMKLLYDNLPDGPNYFIKGSVQIYSTQDGTPLLWDQSKESRMTATNFGNFTLSVFDDSDSISSFRSATNEVATALVARIPQQTYNTHSNIRVTLLENQPHTPATPGDTDQQELQRLENYR